MFTEEDGSSIIAKTEKNIKQEKMLKFIQQFLKKKKTCIFKSKPAPSNVSCKNK